MMILMLNTISKRTGKPKQFFVLCPENVSKEPIINYLDKLKIGEVFNKAGDMKTPNPQLKIFVSQLTKRSCGL